MSNHKIQSPRIMRLYEDLQGGNIEALDIFWKEVLEKGTPLIEKVEGNDEYYLVTLLWKASESIESISVNGEMFGMDTDNTKLERLLGTNLWFRTWKVRGDAQSVYIFIINEREGQEWNDLDARLDPFNPNTYVCVEDEKNPNEFYLLMKEESYVALPNFKKDIWSIERKDVPKGKVELFDDYESKFLNNKRRIWVYTPADYDRKNEANGIAVFTDGWDYVYAVNTPTILDNLIAEKKIDPICAVFIESTEDRARELTCYDPFDDFVTKEILPWLYENYNITTNAEKNVAVGFSYGGLTSAFLGLKHPDIFKKIFCRSGGFSWKPKGDESEKGLIIRKYEDSPTLPLDFYVTFGEFEKEAENLYKGNKDFVKMLADKGYNFKYHEFMGGHTFTDVNIDLAGGLIHLLGK